MTKLSYITKKDKVVSETSQLAIKVLSNKNRHALMKVLINTKKDLCVYELAEAVSMSQSATSHQLSYLEAYGVVKSFRTGKTKCYLLTDSKLSKKVSKIIKLLN
ncbi:MAG: metalloregulator ArsR/SmtB family transcription factor [Candidatus Paceibacterota bacterium]